MTPVFGVEYAAAYDELYRDKDYAAECDLLERIFRCYSDKQVESVLDLGCGTGGHAIRLAERGYTVVGVDRSEEMLQRARQRASAAQFVKEDILQADLGERFDAVLMMFAVLGYQIVNQDVRSALQAARRHLWPGGVLFADVWYGPAVLAQRPSDRVKIIDTPTGEQVIRVASAELDTRRDVCTVRYHLWRIDKSNVSAETCEQHAMRYFFAPELKLFLAAEGFEVIRIGAFPEFDDEPSEQTWNAAFVARAG